VKFAIAAASCSVCTHNSRRLRTGLLRIQSSRSLDQCAATSSPPPFPCRSISLHIAGSTFRSWSLWVVVCIVCAIARYPDLLVPLSTLCLGPALLRVNPTQQHPLPSHQRCTPHPQVAANRLLRAITFPMLTSVKGDVGVIRFAFSLAASSSSSRPSLLRPSQHLMPPSLPALKLPSICSTHPIPPYPRPVPPQQYPPDGRLAHARLCETQYCSAPSRWPSPHAGPVAHIVLGTSVLLVQSPQQRPMPSHRLFTLALPSFVDPHEPSSHFCLHSVAQLRARQLPGALWTPTPPTGLPPSQRPSIRRPPSSGSVELRMRAPQHQSPSCPARRSRPRPFPAHGR
jgi:hypothetical protein